MCFLINSAPNRSYVNLHQLYIHIYRYVYQTWNHSTNTRGRAPQNLISLNCLKVIASTLQPIGHYDTLNFFITNFPNHFSTKIVNLNDPASDYTHVLLPIRAQPSLKKNRPTFAPGTTNRNKFKDIILNKTTLNIKLKLTTDVNQTIAKLPYDIQKPTKDSSIQSPPYSQTPNLNGNKLNTRQIR